MLRVARLLIASRKFGHCLPPGELEAWPGGRSEFVVRCLLFVVCCLLLQFVVVSLLFVCLLRGAFN